MTLPPGEVEHVAGCRENFVTVLTKPALPAERAIPSPRFAPDKIRPQLRKPRRRP